MEIYSSEGSLDNVSSLAMLADCSRFDVDLKRVDADKLQSNPMVVYSLDRKHGGSDHVVCCKECSGGEDSWGFSNPDSCKVKPKCKPKPPVKPKPKAIPCKAKPKSKPKCKPKPKLKPKPCKPRSKPISKPRCKVKAASKRKPACRRKPTCSKPKRTCGKKR